MCTREKTLNAAYSFQLKGKGSMILFVLSLFLFVIPVSAQTILNAYARVVGITSANTVLAVSNVNQVSHTFIVGQQVIVIQMQDDVIGSNTSNNSSFGNLSSIANTGNYEVRTITARTPATGTPITITLNTALTYTYNTGTNSSVQVVTFRDLGTNYTTTANITGLAWNGFVGGVIALQVSNDFTLNHSITATGTGFRGGSVSANNWGPTCISGNENVYISNLSTYAGKGEGIYRNTNTNYDFARGRMLSGGGGGVDHNSGGGGGGNYSQGGQGGNGFSNCTAYPSGGLGGLALSSQISASRLFAGGGGGGGQQNESVGTPGGNGGGIIFLKANRVLTNTTCASAISITSNGVNAANAGNDAAGGGGAGGSMLFQVNTWSINAACPLTIAANGGNGGNSGDISAHAGGAGGGQGAIIFYTAVPVTNITINTVSGQPGADNISGLITATAGSGVNNSGILTFTNPLPIELISFHAQCIAPIGVELKWLTATEKNNAYFILERSSTSDNWIEAGRIPGAGNSNEIKQYNYVDNSAADGVYYYRLRQVDFNGQTTISNPVAVNCEKLLQTISLFPNPAADAFTINAPAGIQTIEIYDNTGRLCRSITDAAGEIQYSVTITDFDPACYTVRILSGGEVRYFKLIKAN